MTVQVSEQQPQPASPPPAPLPPQGPSVQDAADRIGRLFGTTPEQREEASKRLGGLAPPVERVPSNQSAGVQPEDRAPAEGEASAEGETEQQSEAETPIAAPVSWSEEDKAIFAKQPREVQEILARRHAEMDKGFQEKLQQTASERKALEAEAQAVKQLTQRYTAALAAQEQKLQKDLNPYLEVTEAQWAELKQRDLAGYLTERENMREIERKIENGRREQAEIFHKQQREATEAHRNLLKEEYAKVVKAIPEWKDDAKYQAGMKEIADHLRSRGVPDERINSIYTEMEIGIARDAMLYRKLQAQKPEVNKRVEVAPKVLVPGATRDVPTANDQRLSAASQKLRKSGSVHDGANLIGAIIARQKRA